MPGIIVRQFAGLVPAMDLELLDSKFAEVATNCDLRNGKLRAWPAPRLVGSTFGDQVDIGVDPMYQPLAAFGDRQVWLGQGGGERDFILQNFEGTAQANYGTGAFPFRNNPQGRVIYWRIGDNQIRFRPQLSAQEFPLGVPQGPTCSSPTVDGTGLPGGIPFATAYCATYVDQYGGEGPPGTPVLVNNYINGQRISVLVSDASADHPVGIVRLYRAISDFTSGDDPVNAMDTGWHLVSENPFGSGPTSFTFFDTIQSHQIPGDTLISREWFAPPQGPFAALCELKGGWLAVVCADGRIGISQRHQWHAFPGRNTLQMPSNRVADATAWNDTLMITFFDRGPVWVSVTADGAGINTTVREYRSDDAAFRPAVQFGNTEVQSNRTLVSTPFGATYWSQSGVVTLGPEGAQNIATKGLLLPNQIGTEALVSLSIPQNQLIPGFLPIRSAWHRGYYLTSLQSSAQTVQYALLDLPDDVSGSFPDAALTHLDFSAYVNNILSGHCFASDRDRLLFVFNNNCYEWLALDSGPAARASEFQELLPYTWRSKRFTLPQQIAIAAVKIVGRVRGSDCRMKIWCNGRLVVDREVSNSSSYNIPAAKIFRLPAGYRGTDWQFELTGTAPIDEVHLATSVEDLSEA